LLTKTLLRSDAAVLVKITELIGHEQTIEEYLEELKNTIRSDGVLKKPIVVDEKHNVIIDGHHRLEALKRLRCQKIPVYFINYESQMVKIESWRDTEPITKDVVIRSALEGKKLPPKTTRHMVRASTHWVHISHIQKEINIPLEELK